MPGGNSWWRAWAEAAHDPKLRRLPHRLHTYWFRLCCLACTTGGRLPADHREIADWLRIGVRAASRALVELHSRGLLDAFDGGYAPHNWSGRQYLKGSSTERVRRFRKRLHETPPEQSREKKESDAAVNGGASQAELERDLFKRGRQVCGQKAGGLISSLLKAKQFDVSLARSVLELAATKHDPRAFVAASIKAATTKNNDPPDYTKAII